jgi:type IV fimbrial biogenesis protein FimT
MDGMISKRQASGFTMTELIVTMSIVAILLAIGIPSFKYVTVSNRISTEVNGDMQYARTLAIKQGLPVTVCASVAPFAQCDNTSSWQNGWIVFLDSNGDHVVQPTESVVRIQNAFTSTDTFQPGGALTFTWITFNREGYAATNNVNTVTLELHDSTANTAWTRCLEISPVGMLTTQKYQAAGTCQ